MEFWETTSLFRQKFAKKKKVFEGDFFSLDERELFVF